MITFFFPLSGRSCALVNLCLNPIIFADHLVAFPHSLITFCPPGSISLAAT